MDPVAGSSPNEQSEPPSVIASEMAMCSVGIGSSSPQRRASSSSSAGVDSPGKSVRRLVNDGSDLCDMDREPGSSHRHQVLGLSDMENLQDSSEILAQWAQLIPDEAFEQCFQLDDLDSLLENCAGVVDFPNQEPQFLSSSDSGTPENSTETMSQSVSNIGDREFRDDQTIVTTSSDSVGTSTRRSPGKRKSRERNVEAAGDDVDDGGEPGTRPKPSMNADVQERHLRKRLSSSDKSTRYAIQTRTDVDIIDDGYRWRKYGQKPVKNSDHPRNYYRCTTPNCPVRKQVERCTENPRNVLTTYDGNHNHPKNPSHSLRESIAGENHVPIRQQPDGSPRLPPTNYMSHSLVDHMLTGALLDRSRWPKPPPPQGASPLSHRNINMLRAQQLFMLQYQTQYPFLSSMLNLMQNYSLAHSPFLDPSFQALLAAQNYGMRLRAHSDLSIRSAAAAANAALSQQQQQQRTSTAAPLSRSQHRILRMQELMGEKGHLSQPAQPCEPTSSSHRESPLENLDLGDHT